MASVRFQNISQPVIPNQRDSEKIFVFVRKRIISFLPQIIIFIFLIFAPIAALLFSFFSGAATTTSQLGRDLVILVMMAYYLSTVTFIISTWVSFYYDVLVISDERIVEISQNTLFNRSINELVFEQIEDVSSSIKGVLNTIFDSGILDIQTAGSQRNFVIKDIGRVNDIVAIILDLSGQAKKGVEPRSRVPNLAIVGLIGGRLISKNDPKPTIMNFRMNLEGSVIKHYISNKKHRSLREKFDCWWWEHCNQTSASFGNREANVDKSKSDSKQLKKLDEIKGKKHDEMIDF
jgi:hypothetical protein